MVLPCGLSLWPCLCCFGLVFVVLVLSLSLRPRLCCIGWSSLFVSFLVALQMRALLFCSAFCFPLSKKGHYFKVSDASPSLIDFFF
eukprot:m.127269 g.127269  ORF g.127269 m.127269 type:complete len:86 (+) comp16701_c0_seq1:836-1093(+)